MRIIQCKNYEELSVTAAEIVAKQIISKPHSVLGLATGSTPIGMYNKLSELCKNGDIDFSFVKTFNLDEYYPIEPQNDQSYHYFMYHNFFSKINILEQNIHLLNGLTKDPHAECENYENLIEECGGIDLQILGIGENGHIGFNEPAPVLTSKTHLTNLTESTIRSNSRFFENIELVPKNALTMGMASIFKASKIILLANGKNKKQAVNLLLKEEIYTNLPASLLCMHPNVTLICDNEAY